MNNLGAILLLAGLATTESALGQCVLDPIRVERIEGYVVFGFQDQYRVLDKGEIRLLNPSDRKSVMSSVTVDKDGHFQIADAKPGKYILSARSEGLIPAYVDVRITKSKSASPKGLILVVLAADATKECGGAAINVKPKVDIEHVLSTAKRPTH